MGSGAPNKKNRMWSLHLERAWFNDKNQMHGYPSRVVIGVATAVLNKYDVPSVSVRA